MANMFDFRPGDDDQVIGSISFGVQLKNMKPNWHPGQASLNWENDLGKAKASGMILAI